MICSLKSWSAKKRGRHIRFSWIWKRAGHEDAPRRDWVPVQIVLAGLAKVVPGVPGTVQPLPDLPSNKQWRHKSPPGTRKRIVVESFLRNGLAGKRTRSNQGTFALHLPARLHSHQFEHMFLSS